MGIVPYSEFVFYIYVQHGPLSFKEKTMFNYAKTVSKKQTSQMEQARPDQVQNSAGGFVFSLDQWGRLERFLILGSDSNTYYASNKSLTKANASNVEACLKTDAKRTIETIVQVSEDGRAPKNDPAIFALALAAANSDAETRKMALEVMPKVCRTGTHLFHFAAMVNELRGWGRGLRNGIANWYNSKDIGKLEYQLVKYQSRDGWSHKDLLKLSHAEGPTAEHNAAYRWVVDAELGQRDVKRRKNDKSESIVSYEAIESFPRLISAYEELKKVDDANRVAEMIREYRFTHEMIPTQFKNDAVVWEALLEHMPMHALVRNLGKLSAVGIIKPLSSGTSTVVSKLTNGEAIKKSRLHPLAILVALNTYNRGRGIKGSLNWTVVPQISQALDDTFYMAFDVIEPTGKNIMMGVDVSGSMTWGEVAGMTGITPNIGATAMAMATARSEKNYFLHGFSTSFRDLNISAKDTLGSALKKTQSMSMGGTDCALPMLYALKNKIEVDCFVTLTDNETYAGHVHPFQALNQYNQKMGRNAKNIVVGMTSTGFSIADPNDPNSLDIVGFDTTAPAVISDFIRG